LVLNGSGQLGGSSTRAPPAYRQTLAETQKEIAEEEGLAPVLAWVKDLIDQVIAQEFGAPALEFTWSAEATIAILQ
jgi:hypothetical protein